MSVEIFRTSVPIQANGKKIDHLSPVLLLGSCFTESIGNRLLNYKFSTRINPFGIVYNPISIIKGLEDIIRNKHYSITDLNYHNDLYFSFDHHSRFSNPDPERCQQEINQEISAAHLHLSKARFLIITLGSSYGYRLKSNGMLVANCHKLPDHEFVRARLEVDEIVDAFNKMFISLKQFNPELEIILTVSPIRHWRDGAHENQLSKSVLLLAIDKLIHNYTGISYFPAYELMLDELRDYRFYEEDMIHPSKTAIEFIWKRFTASYLSLDTLKIMEQVEKINTAVKHRPFNPQGEKFLSFVHQHIEKITQLNTSYPELDFSSELNYFANFIHKA